MKLRCDFVTNSSSSNVILALKQPLNFSAVHMALIGLETDQPEVFKTLPMTDTFEFAIFLTAFACGHTIDTLVEHEKNVENYWALYWQAEAERHVMMSGEDGAFKKALEGWENVYGESSKDRFPEHEPAEMGKFPKRAFALKAEGYTFVYMFDVNDFSTEDDIMTRLAEWASAVKTDDFVLEVEAYY